MMLWRTRRAFGLCAVVILAGLACPSGAATLPVADWEQSRPTPRTDTGDYSPYVNPRFRSAKTLAATTAWLKSALERYGDVPPVPYDPGNAYRLSNVRFTGCTMQWVERRFMNDGRNIMEHDYTLDLRDVGREPGNLQVLTNGLTVSLGGSSQLHFVERMQERDGAVVAPVSTTSRVDTSFTLPLQGKDDSARRIGTALIHASRLCSAGVR